MAAEAEVFLVGAERERRREKERAPKHHLEEEEKTAATAGGGGGDDEEREATNEMPPMYTHRDSIGNMLMQGSKKLRSKVHQRCTCVNKYSSVPMIKLPHKFHLGGEPFTASVLPARSVKS